ncbi:MAG: ABC transporter permease, partial [Chloroflexota bacterium]|nr:ABC transporter permease [Chloroflexota bacterium]
MSAAGPPALVFAVVIAAWQIVCTAFNVPRYLLPAPGDVVTAWIENRETLVGAVISSFLSALI